MRIAIIGDGLLARHISDAIASYFAAHPQDYADSYPVMFNHSEIDVTKEDSVKAAFDRYEPDVVINTAAYHRLAACERHPDIAYAVNADGPANVGKTGVPQIFISTDYVFNDGGPHDEKMPVEMPRSQYGRSKFAGEIATLRHGGAVVRVAALFGHYRSHKGLQFPGLVLSDDAPLELPVDQRFTPTYAVDAAGRIAQLAIDFVYSRKSPTAWPAHGIYHLTNTGETTWANFAEEIVAVVPGAKRTIIPVEARDPLRPTDSRLASYRLPRLRHFREALVEWAVLRERQRISPLRNGALVE